MSGHGRRGKNAAHGHGQGMHEVLLPADERGGRGGDPGDAWEEVLVALDATRAHALAQRKVVTLLLLVDILTCVGLALLGTCGGDAGRFFPEFLDLKGGGAGGWHDNTTNTTANITGATVPFDVKQSMLDVVVLDSTRWALLLLAFLCLPLLYSTNKWGDRTAAEQREYNAALLLDLAPRTVSRPPSHGSIFLQAAAWWCLFTVGMFTITKFGVWRWDSRFLAAHRYKAAIVAVSGLLAVAQLRYTDLLLQSQRRLGELYKLLLSDLAAKRKRLGHNLDLEAKHASAADEEEEDPRSRFYDDPEKKRTELLKASRTTAAQKGSVFANLKALWTIMQAYVWPHGCLSKLRILFTFAVMAGSKVCTIVAPIYIGQAAQRLSDEGVIPARELCLYTGLSFLGYALAQYQRVVYLGVKQHAFAEIATTTFRHLHSLSLDWHLQKKMGQVIRIMDRGIASADQVMNYLVLYLLPSIVQAFIVFGLFYVKFNSPELAGTAFLSFVFYCVVTIQITMWRKKFRKATNKHDNKYHDLATDSLVNFETVKYFANEEYEIRQFNASVKQYQKHNIATQASLALLNASQQLDIQATTLIALMISASAILHQTGGEASQKIGQFVAVNAYIVQLYAPLSFLGTIYSTVVQAFVDMGNLADLLIISPDIQDRPGAQPLRLHASQSGAKVEFRDVAFHYPSQPSRGLHGISFECAPGTTTAIVGPTGAGKSTVSRLLFRFYDVERGNILVDGQNISAVTQKSLRSAIGVVPQDTVLFNSSLRANIQYGKVGAKFVALQNAARSAQILPFIESLDKGWETTVGERGLKISGGEKQRVAIARCLLKNPPVVVLDEATSALDSATEVAVQGALNTLGRGRTQIVIAHRLSTIMHADQILVLDQGRITERGTHATLLAAKGTYYKLWNAQQDAATGRASGGGAADGTK